MMPLAAPVDLYCERLSAEFWAEPLNALTNVAFLLAAIVAFRVLRQHAEQGKDIPRDLALLPPLLAIIGLGSFLFHTFATGWAMLADVGPILLFQLAAIAVLVRRLFGRSLVKLAVAWAVFLALNYGLFRLFAGVETYGSSGYFAPWLVLLDAAGYLWRRQPKPARYFALAGGIFTISLTLRTLDLPFCPAWPLGLHFLWHCLNAMVLYKTFKGCLRLKQEG